MNSDKSNANVMLDIEEQLKRFEDKAELSRSVYIFCKRRLKFKSNIMAIITVVLTIVLSGVSIWLLFNTTQNNVFTNTLALVFAIAAIIVSFMSVSDRIFGWSEKMVSFDVGIRGWTVFIREIHTFRKTKLKRLDNNSMSSGLQLFMDKYNALASSLPENDLSDLEFLKCKQSFLIKKDISRKLDTNYYIDVETEFNKRTK